jgi:hypothetical protein
VAVGDFNRDGVPDPAVANAMDPGTVSVLLGNGEGTFRSAVNYAVGGPPHSVAVGDFNGDGIPDLAVATDFHTVSVLLGNGDGTFQPAVNYATAFIPVYVAVADFRHNGIIDLVVADEATDPGMVTVLLGNGDGTFWPAVNYATGGVNPMSVAVGDLNGDGIPDLAVVNADSDNVSVLLGNGDGTFQAAVSYAAGVRPVSVAVGDFNGDGTLDLAVAGGPFYDGTVSVLFGNGDGTFHSAVNYAVGVKPISVAVGDFPGTTGNLRSRWAPDAERWSTRAGIGSSAGPTRTQQTVAAVGFAKSRFG